MKKVFATLCYALLHFATFCYGLLRGATICNSMLQICYTYATLCYALKSFPQVINNCGELPKKDVILTCNKFSTLSTALLLYAIKREYI